MKPDLATPRALQFTSPYGKLAATKAQLNLGLDGPELGFIEAMVDDLVVEAVYDALNTAGVLTHAYSDCKQKNKPPVAIMDDYPGEGAKRRITCPRCIRDAEKAERRAGCGL